MIDWMSVDTLIDVIYQGEETIFKLQFVSPVPDVVLHAQGLIAWCERNTGYYLKLYIRSHARNACTFIVIQIYIIIYMYKVHMHKLCRPTDYV